MKKFHYNNEEFLDIIKDYCDKMQANNSALKHKIEEYYNSGKIVKYNQEQFDILYTIWKEERISIDEFSQCLGIGKRTLYRRINDYENRFIEPINFDV